MIRIGNNLSDLNNSHVVPAIAGGAIPPTPSTADMFFCASTFGLTGETTLFDGIGDTTDSSIATTLVSPYPCDWASVIPALGSNPKLLGWNDQSVNTQAVAQNDDNAFRPAINVTDKRFDFDGTNDFLYRSDLTGGDVATVTWYAIMRTGTFGAIRPLFASDYDVDFSFGNRILIGYIDASGNLISAQDGAGVNSKSIALAANTTYILTGVYDRANVVAADQTKLFVNNSATGASSPASADQGGTAFQLSTFNFALGRAEISAAPQYFNGAMMHLQFHNTAHDSTLRTAWYDRLAYYATEAGW